MCAHGWFLSRLTLKREGESSMLTAEMIDEVRRIVRLEALRASVLSVASESLDQHIPRLVVVVALQGETLEASIEYLDSTGAPMSGGAL